MLAQFPSEVEQQAWVYAMQLSIKTRLKVLSSTLPQLTKFIMTPEQVSNQLYKLHL